jgi:hypothetical protein
MNKLLQTKNLIPADRIVVPKSSLSLVQHHAIYLGKDQFGRDLIAENVFGQRVQITPLDQFIQKNPIITRIESFKGNNPERRDSVEYALKLMGKPYHLINFNCEHFANEVQHKVSFSPQIRIGVSVLLFIGLMTFFFKTK